MYDLFGELSVPALDIVDRGSVTLERSLSGRSVYKVQSHSGALQHCSYPVNYCACWTTGLARVTNVPTSSAIWCEHLIAVLVLNCLKKVNQITVSDEKMTHTIELMYTCSSGSCM
ncbi:unnamed protein product [Dicrocoelium dendriticum]|nr:unnamed protein product [Dicrocoelium dendriticum]